MEKDLEELLKLSALHYTTTIKTSVFKGILAEDDFKDKINDKFIEDAIVYVDGDNFHKRYIILSSTDRIPNRVLTSIETAINPGNRFGNKVFQLIVTSGIPQLIDSKGTIKNIDEIFKIKENLSKPVSTSLIDVKQNYELINKMSVEQLTKFVRRSILTSFCNPFIPHTYSLNIDLISYDKDVISIYELKQKNMDGYDDIMNISEYKLLRDFSSKMDVKFFIKKRNQDWKQKEIIFEMNPKTKEMAARTSYHGKNTQRVYIMKFKNT